MNDPTTHRVLTVRGPLRVVICPLCASLVIAVGLEQHARAHAADVDRRRDADGATADCPDGR